MLKLAVTVVILALLTTGGRVLAQQQQIEEENLTSKLLLPRRYNNINVTKTVFVNEYTIRWSKKTVLVGRSSTHFRRSYIIGRIPPSTY